MFTQFTTESHTGYQKEWVKRWNLGQNVSRNNRKGMGNGVIRK